MGQRPNIDYSKLDGHAKRRKYGCYCCADKCEDGEPCRYADIMNRYENYEAYDKEMKKLLGGIMKRGGR